MAEGGLFTFSSTTRTGGAISSTFIFTDTAALYVTMDARHFLSSSNPAARGSH
jgi:hypothetical protein